MRVKYSRGFGIQSPWAYRFVRYVINEHYPYYAYKELSSLLDSLSPVRQKLFLLYFRIANYAQAGKWFTTIEDSSLLAHFIQAGCHHSQLVTVSRLGMFNYNQGDVLIVSAFQLDDAVLDSFLDNTQNKSILIIEDIHKNSKLFKGWTTLTGDSRCGVSFDLYYCGIIFFDHKLHKHHYLINF